MIRHSAPTIGEAEIDACARVLRSGHLAQGFHVAAFERECAAYVGRRHGVAVNSGTSALQLALEILGVPRDQSVAIPAYTCAALATAVVQHGAQPFLCDCGDDYNMDVSGIPSDLPAIAVHMFGASATLPPNPVLVEDIAQAIGAPVGRTGNVTIISFYATKLLTTGEGGMLLTDDDALAEHARDLRDYDNRDVFARRHNFKMTDFQAAIGSVQLGRLDQFISRRREIAQQYNDAFRSLPMMLPKGDYHVYSRYVVALENRDALAIHLKRSGIEAKKPVYKPLHHLGFTPSNCPNADQADRQCLSLPIYPSLSDSDVDRIIRAVLAFFA